MKFDRGLISGRSAIVARVNSHAKGLIFGSVGLVDLSVEARLLIWRLLRLSVGSHAKIVIQVWLLLLLLWLGLLLRHHHLRVVVALELAAMLHLVLLLLRRELSVLLALA